MQAIGLRPKVRLSADGARVVGHAGARLPADLADATGLIAGYSTTLRPLRPRGTGYDPGRIATDLAVMLADGGEAIADLAVPRDQPGVFSPIASTPTARRGGVSRTPRDNERGRESARLTPALFYRHPPRPTLDFY